MKKSILSLTYLLIALFTITSCSNDKSSPSPKVPAAVEFVYEGMTQFYFWYKEIPSNIKKENYTDPIEMVDDMIFSPTDRWTHIVKDDGALADQILEGTQNGIIGISIAYDAQENLRIVYALPDSPADQAGIKRSDIIQKINGVPPVPGESLTFGEVPELEVLSKDGTVRTLTLNRANITENPVLHKEVKEVDGMKVGYLVFNTFNGLAEDELNTAFSEFNAAGINELVIDLRYNGGGLVNAAQHFASLMVPAANYGDVFIAEEFNDKNNQFNESLYFEAKDNNIAGISKVVFLVTGRTASASELVMNGLKPYMDITIIGQNTSGKYVGASLFTFEDYTFIPITFQSANAEGNVFIGGFRPDIDANDDITHDFGDPNEEMFSVALSYLSGNLGGARRSAEIKPLEILNQEGYWNGPAIEIGEKLD